MPHAVPREPFSSFNLPHRGSAKNNPNSSAATRFGQLTPPEEMNASAAPRYDFRSHHGFAGVPHHGYAQQPHPAPPMNHYPQPARVPHQHTQHPGPTGAAGYANGNGMPPNAATPPTVQQHPQAPAYHPMSKVSSVKEALQIPARIRAPQKTLPELAAYVTSLFWFESSELLLRIETSPHGLEPTAVLPRDAKPDLPFQKWVTLILTTTMVSREVIVLALLFIFRLKKNNPTVKGKEGSEYRLLTVALMLGNKYLDDNTYTNKTWADVTGISVLEIHIMEVEFLSNMKYNLYASEAQWEEWHDLLGKFGSYIHKAIKLETAPRQYNNLTVPTGVHSPTAPNVSPPFAPVYSPHHRPYSSTPMLQPQANSTAVSPMGPLPDPQVAGRKRSIDDRLDEPPAKRPNYGQVPHLPPPSSLTNGFSHANGVQLPSLKIPTQLNLPPPQQLMQSRAMPSVYPPPMSVPPSSTPSTLAPVHANSMNGPSRDQSRQVSPFPRSAGSSPTGASFPQSSGVSPSIYLPHRNSPYGPRQQVRHLVAPVDAHHPPHVPQSQMQYRTIGQYNTPQTGPLPYTHHPEHSWAAIHQPNQLRRTDELTPYPNLPVPQHNQMYRY